MTMANPHAGHDRTPVKLKLIIEVTYDPCGVSKTTLSAALQRAARHAASNGDLTDIDGHATVLRWDARVEEGR